VSTWDQWFAALSDDEVPQVWARSMQELRDRGLVRSANNPVSDIAERLASEYLGLELAPKSAQGYDAVAPDGTRYQVKSRRLTPQNMSRRMGVIRKLELVEFDFAVAMIFDEFLTLVEMWKIPHAAVVDHSRWVETLNGHVFYCQPPITSDARVERLK
jgi:hypothetical protein